MSARELAVLIPLLVCILWLGVYPKPFLRRMEPSARQLIEQVRPGATQGQPPFTAAGAAEAGGSGGDGGGSRQ